MEYDGIILPYPLLVFRTDLGHFELLQPFITPEHVVPAGSITDGATVPDLLEAYVKKFDKHLPAAIVHDWMYANAIGTKKEADDLFEKNLWRCHYAFDFPADKIGPMVKAVRLFGRGSYGKSEK